ncbi:HupE/UreJ family protein [Myxococcus llanfairpwllgwyngyllgogerychwyrndrobwllllantysiliogogogochensis]|uniref:HupE/UreJ family protein n=1 Tax=Myxococcus llanfairpwllgwyngyllgogerychwyrndrobwllllantysiliogogogochensis TaxID=2590453 RepID=A0A540X6N5_9BACT|nr:HupE/UreJ family protein [Myxococcus llanfairpwllgwyngyllgogerychwyrndrobwllllantysiliogogogochensis]TQF16915.1 HupE/UreJ family protein [Myxococcus llanfairpwllgwyngyllgogerychwyrndrobwllllantysiliogogogochensis]
MNRILALLVLLPAIALAHKPSDSYLHLERAAHGFNGRWDVALRDLDTVLGLDSNGDGALAWGEVRTRQEDIARHVLSRLSLGTAGMPCPTTAEGDLRVARHSDGAYAVLDFRAACPVEPSMLTLDYTLLFDRDPQHRGVVQVTGEQGQGTLILSASRHAVEIPLARLSAWSHFGGMVHSGVEHIWAGLDHLLFLLALLLPSVLRRSPTGGWEPVDRFGPALRDVVKVVSAFTVAHSLTLSVAALGLVSLPSRLVESAIAVSVILAAANNVFPRVRGTRWAVAFALGLLHGFGFASVLADLGLPAGGLATTLLGFNVGVELGQLACVAVFLPVAFLLRGASMYRRAILVGGSAAIGLIACVWLAERALDLSVLPL